MELIKRITLTEKINKCNADRLDKMSEDIVKLSDEVIRLTSLGVE